MRVIGLKINSMDKGLKPGPTGRVSKEFISKDRSMAMESSNGLTEVYMKVNFSIITSMDRVFIVGKMDGFTKGLGRITRWMAMDSLDGLMAGSIKATIEMIRSTVSEFLNGLMVGSTRDYGLMESRMGKACISLLRVLRGRANGLMASDFDGWIMIVSKSVKFSNIKIMNRYKKSITPVKPRSRRASLSRRSV